jgi:geranylgeranyl transferase type-2 subunit beta
MNDDPYLLRLQLRLQRTLASLPEAFRLRHARRLASLQSPDGGFPGREGDDDPYYTAFALRGLAILDALTPSVRERAAPYLRRALRQQVSPVDFFSLLDACTLLQLAGGPDPLADSPPDWPDRAAALLETFRTSDGGYGKTPGAASGSTYHSFLIRLALEFLGKPPPDEDALLRFVQGRQRADGGYVEIAPMRRSGVNPTAAAVGLLTMLSRPFDPQPPRDFLVSMQSSEGGLLANARAPLADLLSTFTGLWTLEELRAADRLDRPAMRRYVAALELPDGGFRGGAWDDRTDAEYTFYGVGVSALLWEGRVG